MAEFRKNDSPYFPHFSNARNDPKLLRLRRILKGDGYAVYFMLLEVLREQPNFRYPLNGLSELEFDFRYSKEVILSVINDYDLFEIDDKQRFFSPKFNFYLQPYLERSERARQAALLRWNSANADANASPNADASKVKESEVKKTEVKETNGFDVLPFNSDKFKTAWTDWDKHRKEIRHKLTDSQIEKQLKKLSKYTEDEAIQMIEYSIENGYQGLFEPKHKKTKEDW